MLKRNHSGDDASKPSSAVASSSTDGTQKPASPKVSSPYALLMKIKEDSRKKDLKRDQAELTDTGRLRKKDSPRPFFSRNKSVSILIPQSTQEEVATPRGSI